MRSMKSGFWMGVGLFAVFALFAGLANAGGAVSLKEATEALKSGTAYALGGHLGFMPLVVTVKVDGKFVNLDARKPTQKGFKRLLEWEISRVSLEGNSTYLEGPVYLQDEWFGWGYMSYYQPNDEIYFQINKPMAENIYWNIYSNVSEYPRMLFGYFTGTVHHWNPDTFTVSYTQRSGGTVQISD